MHVENSNSQNVNYTIASCQRGTSQGSYRIHFGDGSSFFLSVDFFLHHKISKGLVLSPELLVEVKEESLFVEAYIKASSLLSRQLYSEFNLKRKLLNKDYDKHGIDQAIDYLRQQGRIDDRHFGENWVESRLRNKLDSYIGLSSALMRKGISSSIAKSVLNELYSDEIESDIIMRSILKLRKQGKTTEAIVLSLTRKGFKQRKVLALISNVK